ncbi:MAG: hypothetical protein K8F62_10895 [Pseudorhodoplanes sp.]|nr:hypothetical protein [Pseudorhodoplanes sp.]
MRKHSPADIINNFTSAERALKSGVRVPAEKIAELIEQNPSEPMPKAFGKYVVSLLRDKSVLPVGRKAMDDAKWDFILYGAKRKYDARLAKGMSSEEAIEETRKEFVPEIGNISGKRLLNRFSEFKRCEVSEAEEIAPDDRDAPDHVPETVRIPLRGQWIR